MRRSWLRRAALCRPDRTRRLPGVVRTEAITGTAASGITGSSATGAGAVTTGATGTAVVTSGGAASAAHGQCAGHQGDHGRPSGRLDDHSRQRRDLQRPDRCRLLRRPADDAASGRPTSTRMAGSTATPSTCTSRTTVPTRRPASPTSQQEVTQDHVIAFVGNLMPLTVSASVPYLQQQNIPVIGGDASSADLVAEPGAVPSGLRDPEPTSRSSRSRRPPRRATRRWRSCTASRTPRAPTGNQASISRAAHKPTARHHRVYSSSFSITQPDFTAQCLDAKQAGATFIYFAGDGDSLVRMANDCAAQGYEPLFVGDSIAMTAGRAAGQPPQRAAWPASRTSPGRTATRRRSGLPAGGQDVRPEPRRARRPPRRSGQRGCWRSRPTRTSTATPTSAEFFQGLVEHQEQQPGGPRATTDVHPGRRRDPFELLLPHESCRTANSSTRTTGTRSASRDESRRHVRKASGKGGSEWTSASGCACSGIGSSPGCFVVAGAIAAYRRLGRRQRLGLRRGDSCPTSSRAASAGSSCSASGPPCGFPPTCATSGASSTASRTRSARAQPQADEVAAG